MEEKHGVEVGREGSQAGGARSSNTVSPIVTESEGFQEHRGAQLERDEEL